MFAVVAASLAAVVALRKESVDRNKILVDDNNTDHGSLSARRAWIEIRVTVTYQPTDESRSPQGERG